MDPGERDALHDRLHRFAFGFGQIRALDPESVALMLEEWVDAVEDLPYEAVHRACKGWVQGAFRWAKTGFAPNADEIGRAAREMVCALKMEDRALRRLIEAKPVDDAIPLDDAQREANQAAFAGLLSDLMAGRKVEPWLAGAASAERQTALADLARIKAEREEREKAEAPPQPQETEEAR